MKLCIPTIGDIITLSSDWKFNLYSEYRNEGLITAFGHTFTWQDDHNKIVISPTLKKGTQLKVDRIYIRKGAQNFDSISFIIQNTELAKNRFWAKLEDVNKIEFNDTQFKDDHTKNKLVWRDVPNSHRIQISTLYNTKYQVHDAFNTNIQYYPYKWYLNNKSYNMLELHDYNIMSDSIYIDSDINGIVDYKIRFKIEKEFKVMKLDEAFTLNQIEKTKKELFNRINSMGFIRKAMMSQKNINDINLIDDVLMYRFKLIDVETGKEYFSKNKSSLKTKAKKILGN